MINAEVSRNNNESNANLIRRFTRRVQDSGVLRRARSLRFYARPASSTVQKNSRLKSLSRKEHFEELAKLGKLPERTKKGRRR